jgi:hypothetical protein
MQAVSTLIFLRNEYNTPKAVSITSYCRGRHGINDRKKDKEKSPIIYHLLYGLRSF